MALLIGVLIAYLGGVSLVRLRPGDPRLAFGQLGRRLRRHRRSSINLRKVLREIDAWGRDHVGDPSEGYAHS